MCLFCIVQYFLRQECLLNCRCDHVWDRHLRCLSMIVPKALLHYSGPSIEHNFPDFTKPKILPVAHRHDAHIVDYQIINWLSFITDFKGSTTMWWTWWLTATIVYPTKHSAGRNMIQLHSLLQQPTTALVADSVRRKSQSLSRSTAARTEIEKRDIGHCWTVTS